MSDGEIDDKLYVFLGFDGKDAKFLNLLVLILILVLLFGGIGTWPAWQHSAGWGYGPSGGIGLILLILIVLALTGRL